jgi:hypothetical protein
LSYLIGAAQSFCHAGSDPRNLLNRYFLAGYVWLAHYSPITEILEMHDRQSYLRWVFEGSNQQ